MRYLFLIYSEEARELDGYLRALAAFTDEVKEKGVHQGSASLQPVATATTVRVRGGKTTTTDGPFAETAEPIVGFYLLECGDLDEALDYAARMPAANHGSIEVRPVLRAEDDPAP